ncbi:MAG: asparagine--tRNA ligase [Gammaproteobacteria bacterium]|nr:asparagine--tRNA ligase [Gammaproteobacteria bacterium]
MQNTFSVKDLLAGFATTDSIITTNGWVRTRRDSKAGFSFIMLNDGSCFDSIQIIAPQDLNNYENDVLKLSAGCSIKVTGKIVQSPGQGQAFEIQATEIEVLGFVDDPETYPITPKHHTLEYLREHAHLRARTNTIGAVTRVQNCIAQAIHRFMHERGFYWIHTPIITGSDCEGAGEMFRVSTLDLMNLPKTDKGEVDFSQDFFGKETFLTVSGQLNVESYCQAMSKVYTFGPTFRAENSNTTRHLAEFWMIEPEIAFADLMDNAKLAEEMLKYIAKAVLEERIDDMEFFAKRIDKNAITRLENLINSEFTVMEYTDAIKHLEQANKKFQFPVKWGMDMQSEHERYLTEELVKAPVTVINYPKDIKAFYMRLNDDEKTVAAMDVLVPGIGEIIGGSQREERLNILDKRIVEMGLDIDGYSWYRDLRRYGTTPHSGFGMGFERCVGYMTGMGNIRDIIPFPRTVKHANF